METINKLFSESGRTWIYGVAAAVVAILAGYGLVTDELAPLWLSLIAAVLWALGNITAIMHTDSKGRMALYGVALAILALLVGYRVVSAEQASMWGALAAAVFGVGTNVLARTKVTPKEVEHG